MHTGKREARAARAALDFSCLPMMPFIRLPTIGGGGENAGKREQACYKERELFIRNTK